MPGSAVTMASSSSRSISAAMTRSGRIGVSSLSASGSKAAYFSAQAVPARAVPFWPAMTPRASSSVTSAASASFASAQMATLVA